MLRQKLSKNMTKFKTAKNVTSFNLRITAKPHAHVQTLTNIPAKFIKKHPGKIVGGVAFTRDPVFIWFGKS